MSKLWPQWLAGAGSGSWLCPACGGVVIVTMSLPPREDRRATTAIRPEKAWKAVSTATQQTLATAVVYRRHEEQCVRRREAKKKKGEKSACS